MKRTLLGTGAIVALMAGQAHAASGITDTVTPLITVKATTATNYSTPWLNQLSLPAATTSGSKGGPGVSIGSVDTGVIASNSAAPPLPSNAATGSRTIRVTAQRWPPSPPARLPERRP